LLTARHNHRGLSALTVENMRWLLGISLQSKPLARWQLLQMRSGPIHLVSISDAWMPRFNTWLLSFRFVLLKYLRIF
jgi:hypothetical protein